MRKKKWTYDKCKEESLKYHRLRDFEKMSCSAYVISRRNGWIKDFIWLEKSRMSNGYWRNKDIVFRVSKECSSRYMFKIKYPTAYDVARKNNWLDEMHWFRPIIMDRQYTNYVIYAYIDDDNKSVYIGLTNNKERRHKEHLTHKNYKGKDISSTPYEYFINNGKELPKPIYLENNLTAEEAQELEEKWIKNYNELGYRILNKLTAGGLGGSRVIWTKDKVIEESKKYQYKSEFKEKCNGAYNAAMRNNWLKLLVWLKPKIKKSGYWKDKSNIINAALLCKNRSEFKKRYYNAYKWAKEYNMLDDLFY